MALLADFLLAHVPLPSLPHYLTSYVPGETPLSTWTSVCTALVSYLAIVFGTREIMKSRPPQKLNALFRAHNIFLSVGSLILVILMMETVLPIMWSEGVFNAMCADESWTTVSQTVLGMVPR
jgi:fatty acid elongase 3